VIEAVTVLVATLESNNSLCCSHTVTAEPREAGPVVVTNAVLYFCWRSNLTTTCKCPNALDAQEQDINNARCKVHNAFRTTDISKALPDSGYCLHTEKSLTHVLVHRETSGPRQQSHQGKKQQAKGGADHRSSNGKRIGWSKYIIQATGCDGTGPHGNGRAEH